MSELHHAGRCHPGKHLRSWQGVQDGHHLSDERRRKPYARCVLRARRSWEYLVSTDANSWARWDLAPFSLFTYHELPFPVDFIRCISLTTLVHTLSLTNPGHDSMGRSKYRTQQQRNQQLQPFPHRKNRGWNRWRCCPHHLLRSTSLVLCWNLRRRKQRQWRRWRWRWRRRRRRRLSPTHSSWDNRTVRLLWLWSVSQQLWYCVKVMGLLIGWTGAFVAVAAVVMATINENRGCCQEKRVQASQASFEEMKERGLLFHMMPMRSEISEQYLFHGNVRNGFLFHMIIRFGISEQKLWENAL